VRLRHRWHPRPVRAVLTRVLAACSALTWLVWPGFGLPDLAVSWSASWPVVLEAGWGLFATGVAGAFVGIAVRPRRGTGALAVPAVATVALAVSALAGQEPRALLLAGLLAGQTAATAALARPVGDRAARGVSWPLLLVAGAGVVPWTAYALTMWRAARDGARVDVTDGVDHAVVQGALAVCLATLALVAATWPPGRRLLATGTGLAATYLGLVSLAWPGAVAGPTRASSVLALAWGVAMTASGLVRPRAQAVRRARTSSGQGVERPSATHT
jgi:hypothetical protein